MSTFLGDPPTTWHEVNTADVHLSDEQLATVMIAGALANAATNHHLRSLTDRRAEPRGVDRRAA